MSDASPNPNSNPNPNPNSPHYLNPNPPTVGVTDIVFNEAALKNVIIKMQKQSFSSYTPTSLDPVAPMDLPGPDLTLFLSDELLLNVLSKLPISEHVSTSLVCKRWLCLHGRLVQSLKLLEWGFLETGRVFARFPNLTDIDVVHACIRSPRNSEILANHKALSVHIDSQFSSSGFIEENDILRPSVIDTMLKVLSIECPNLQRLVMIGGTGNGLATVAEYCDILQELELHCCGDIALKAILGFRNLQIVKLIGFIDGFYSSVISDIGLTLLAQGCRRLVKLELCGCEGSYDGIKAIGQCCFMLEELTLSDHRMDGGWLAALSFCENLKTLRLQSCNSIDSSPGLDEHLGSCMSIERLHLQRCQVRDKLAVKALFLVCGSISELVLQDCWGLDDDVFSITCICRRLKLLSLQGCSSLRMKGLELVILSLKDLQSLKVESCPNIKDSEVTPAIASLFSVLKDLKWQPDSRSLLRSSLEETGVGIRGGRFFKGLKA